MKVELSIYYGDSKDSGGDADHISTEIYNNRVCEHCGSVKEIKHPDFDRRNEALRKAIEVLFK